MVIAREETPCRCGRVKLDRVGSAVPVGFAAPGREHDAVGTALAAAQRYLHPDAAAIAAAGDSLRAFLSARGPPNGPRLRALQIMSCTASGDAEGPMSCMNSNSSGPVRAVGTTGFEPATP